MKRVIAFAAVMILLPGIIAACPRLGLFNNGLTHYDPEPFEPFKLYLYIVQEEFYVTAVEYQIVTPSDPAHAIFMIIGVEYPKCHSVDLGSPLGGHSLCVWPPVTGYPDGCDLLATFTCITTLPCSQMYNYILTVGPHPDTGLIRGTYYPDNEMFDIRGMSSLLCLKGYAAGDESWGAIKSLFR